MDDRSTDESERESLRRSADASVPAIVATVALVVLSVFIGVYGPRLGNRQQLPGGTTLVELASYLSARHATETFSTIDLLRSADTDDAAIAGDASVLLGRRVELPEIAGRNISWLRVSRLRAPGGSGVQLLARVGRRANADYASIFVIRDEDRFTVFDAFGRPRAMPEGETFSVGVNADAGATVVHVFRTGDLVYAVESADRGLADEIVAALQTVAAADAREAEDASSDREP